MQQRARLQAGSSLLLLATALSALGATTGCGRSAAVQTGTSLPLRRVVIYRNGVGYFERQGHVDESEVRFRVSQSEVGDFLATLAVMERGGSSVRAAAFPMPEERPADAPPRPEERRTVRLSLDGRDHDLLVGYTVETPIWRPSYRLIFNGTTTQVQAWGIVQNLSGEDWSDVHLSLVSGSPVSFRSELAQAVVPPRPVVTDQGAVIDAVPLGDTTLAQEQANTSTTPPVVQATPSAPAAQSFVTDALEASAGEAAPDDSRHARFAGRRAAGNAPMQAPSVPMGGATYWRGNTVSRAPAPPPPPTATPRNINALAALAVQGGATRYDLPNTVTIPDRSATMVMLASRDIPGQQMYLFAPDPGVPDSSTHPFHVARFENRTGAMLERGPIAIFEAGDFLGEGLLDPLPDAATTTVPFALERALAVDNNAIWAQEGARLVRMLRDTLTIERFNVQRTTYHLRNGMDREVRVMVRQALNGATLFEQPPGAELTNNNALVPTTVPARGHSDLLVTTRTPFSVQVDLTDEQSPVAIEQYLREGHPPDDVAASLRTSLDMRRQMEDLARERTNLDQRRTDQQQTAEETRANLLAIQRNPQAADLRARLTARLGTVATALDQITRRIVELDTQIGERRVRLAETVRGIDIDTSRTTPPATTPATAPTSPPSATARPH